MLTMYTSQFLQHITFWCSYIYRIYLIRKQVPFRLLFLTRELCDQIKSYSVGLDYAD